MEIEANKELKQETTAVPACFVRVSLKKHTGFVRFLKALLVAAVTLRFSTP